MATCRIRGSKYMIIYIIIAIILFVCGNFYMGIKEPARFSNEDMYLALFVFVVSAFWPITVMLVLLAVPVVLLLYLGRYIINKGREFKR